MSPQLVQKVFQEAQKQARSQPPAKRQALVQLARRELPQTLALLMTERGISSCVQGALGLFPDPARRMFGLPDDVGILFGMSFGYADDAAPANKTRTDRVSLDAMVRFF